MTVNQARSARPGRSPVLVRTAAIVVYCGSAALFSLFLYQGSASSVYFSGIPLFFSFPVLAMSLSRWEGRCGKAWLVAVVAPALLFRVSLWGVKPEVLSNDVYRYLWDGKLSWNRINPFSYAPADDRLAPLKNDPLYDKVAHRTFKTIYPPVSQFVFMAAYAMGKGRLWPLRLIYLLAEAGLVLLLLGLLRDRRRIVWYVFCPLVIVETHAGLHVDIISAVLLTAAFALLQKRSFFPMAAAAVSAALTKYIPVVALPVFFLEQVRSVRSRRGAGLASAAVHSLPAWLLAGLLAIILFLPFLGVGWSLFEQLLIYNRHWEFNASLYSICQWVAGDRTFFVRLVLTAAALLAVYASSMGAEARVKWSMLSLLLLGPTLYPWYLICLIPFMFMDLRASDAVLVTVVYLSYWILVTWADTGVWRENASVKLLQFVPYYSLLAFELVRRRDVQEL
ncbi:MAG: hypothetical protein AB1714_08995 [Acidobacteriota bacterium]